MGVLALRTARWPVLAIRFHVDEHDSIPHLLPLVGPSYRRFGIASTKLLSESRVIAPKCLEGVVKGRQLWEVFCGLHPTLEVVKSTFPPP